MCGHVECGSGGKGERGRGGQLGKWKLYCLLQFLVIHSVAEGGDHYLPRYDCLSLLRFLLRSWGNSFMGTVWVGIGIGMDRASLRGNGGKVCRLLLYEKQGLKFLISSFIGLLHYLMTMLVVCWVDSVE